MKIVGKNSLVSILRILVNISLYLQYFGAIVLVIFFVASVSGGPDGEDTMILGVNLAESSKLPEIELNSRTYEQVRLKVTQGELHFMPEQHHFWWLLILVLGLFVVGYTILITLYVKKLFRALEEGAFFTMQNAHQLRILSLLIVLTAPLKFAGTLISNLIIATQLNIEGLIPGADFDFMLLFTGLVLLIFSELFKEGAKLQEEINYTV